MDLLDGRFQIETRCGSGASSQVFRARDLETGEQVAVKISFNEDEDQRFSREVELTRQLHHPNTVHFVARGETAEGNPYVVLEWIEGETLAARVSEGPMPWRLAVSIAYQAAEGLAALHRLGIVHRDIKPTNIMVGGTTEMPRVKIIDLGVARDLSKASLTRAGSLIGTPHYMAPEMASGSGNPLPATDVYGLCAVLYEILTTKKLFDAEPFWDLLGQVLIAEPIPPRVLVPELPEELERLLLRGLAKAPEKRFENCEVLADALSELLRRDDLNEKSKKSQKNGKMSVSNSNQGEHESADQLKQRPDDEVVPDECQVTDGDAVEMTRLVLLLVDLKRDEPKRRAHFLQEREQVAARITECGGQFVALPGRRMLGLFQGSGRIAKQIERALNTGLTISSSLPARTAVMLSRRWGKEGAILGLSKLAGLLKRSVFAPGVRVPKTLENWIRTRYRYFSDSNSCFVSGLEPASHWSPRLLEGREDALGRISAFLERGVSPVMLVCAQAGVGRTAVMGRARILALAQGFRVVPVEGLRDLQELPGSGFLRLLRVRAGLDESLGHREASILLGHQLAQRGLGVPEDGEREPVTMLQDPDPLDKSGVFSRLALLLAATGRDRAEKLVAEASAKICSLQMPGTSGEGELWLIDDLDAWDGSGLSLLAALVAESGANLKLIASCSREAHASLSAYFESFQPERLKLEPLDPESLQRLLERSGAKQPESWNMGGCWGNLWLLGRFTAGKLDPRLVGITNQSTAHALFNWLWSRSDVRLLNLLQLAAILGPRGWLRDLCRLTKIRDPQPFFAEIEAMGFWKPAAIKGQYAFASTEFWRWTYALCPQSWRHSWHSECATWFKSGNAPMRQLAAEHFLAIGEQEDAQRLLLERCLQAHACGIWQELAHFSMKLDQLNLSSAERARVRFWRALAHVGCGRPAAAKAALTACRRDQELEEQQREQASRLLARIAEGKE